MHTRFRIGLPKIHRRFRIGPPEVTLNLFLPEFHSWWILVYNGYYARKATKLPIWNRMTNLERYLFALLGVPFILYITLFKEEGFIRSCLMDWYNDIDDTNDTDNTDFTEAFLRTFLGLFEDFMWTFWGLSKDFLRSFWLLSDNFLQTFWWLSEDFLRTFWRLSDNFQKTFIWLSEDFLRTCWEFFEEFLRTFWGLSKLWFNRLSMFLCQGCQF